MSTTAAKNENISEVKLQMTLNDIQNFKSLDSNIFCVNGNPWIVTVDKEYSYLRISLIPKMKNVSKDWAIVAALSVKIIPHKVHMKSFDRNVYFFVFYHGSLLRKWPILAFSQLIDCENGYVANDTCKIEINVRPTPLLVLTQHEWLQFEPIPKCCANNLDEKFRMTVNIFNGFIGVCSPDFIASNSNWRISVVKSEILIQINLLNTAENNDYAKRPSVSCTLIPFDQNSRALQKKVECFTCFKLEIVWDELIKPSNGYVQDNSFVLEFTMITKTAKRRSCDDDGDQLTCTICSERLNKLPASSLQCGHIFCTACIEKSIQQQKRCPTCNHPATACQIREVFLPLQ